MRRVLLSVAWALALLLWLARPAGATNDPALEWRTMETPHFRINYYSGEEEIAEHVADLGEAINARLEPVLGWKVSQKTEINITDQTDSANGSATAIPYNAIQLYVTAPSDNSPLGDVDDWYQELVTHEYTHILHTDHIRGLPAVLDAIIGKAYAPNQAQAKWLLEGLAVLEESEKTSGGRLRSSQWNMWMRADVLENHVAPLDVFSNTPRRWPEGNIYYVYGSFFMQWVAETYGEASIRRMIDDYGSELIPFGINRSIQRATGRTWEEMYPSFIDTLRREFTAQANAIQTRGLREGKRVTFAGYNAEHPRWIPANAWDGWGGQLLYFRDDGNSRTGFYGVPLVRDAQGNVTGALEKKRELMVRTDGDGSLSFEPDGAAVWSQTEETDNLFFFNDLFEMPRGKKSPSGHEGDRRRLSVGYRAVDPDVSPDGRRVAFTANHRGTTRLIIGDLTRDRQIVNMHTYAPGLPFDQAFTPRWSPDNVHVAYSSWSRGGYRDVRIVNANDATFIEVTHDRALDMDPSWSADGKTLYFTSDRTGVMNVYAYDVATKGLKQVTNVVNGAYYPEASPDGKTLAYIGYTTFGFDLFVMPLDPSRFLDALPYTNYRPEPPPIPPHHDYPSHAYNPLPTLTPRSYMVSIASGGFGYQTTVSATGSDITGRHNVSLSLTTPFSNAIPQPTVQYTFTGFPVDLSFQVYRSISPGSYSLNGNNMINFITEQAGFQTGVTYNKLGAFDSMSVSSTYSFERMAANMPFIVSQVDPYAPVPGYSLTGVTGILHLGWSYSNAESYLWSVSAERGFSANAGIDLADPILGSAFRGYDASANLAGYIPMPWLRHHTVALHASVGTSGGNYPGEGLFYVGGFQNLSILNTLENQLVQSGVELRGYPVVEQEGPNFALFNAEYRFPLVNIDRGISTYPIFLNRVNAAVFGDFGSAFGNPSSADFKLGTGAEVWIDITLGYQEGFTFRGGYAHGWSTDGMDQFYFVSAVSF